MKSLAEYVTLFEAHTISLASGATAHYREANRGAKRTIIIIHGITGTHYSMLQMAGLWAERGDHVIAIDLPGHGKSDRVTISEFNHLADWLNEVILAIYPSGDFVLVGNSFGSSVGAAYARKYGLRGKSGLILGAPIPSVNKLLQKLEKLSTYLPDVLIRKVYYENALLELIRMRVLLAKLSPQQVRRIVRDMIRTEAVLVQHGYAFGHLMPYNYEADPLGAPFANDIRRRTRVIHGNKDRIAGRDVHKRMVKVAGQENVIVVKNSGHLVHVEALPELTRAIDELSTPDK
jgi:pimeloyl-ACP methyl ester carboxylesterase